MNKDYSKEGNSQISFILNTQTDKIEHKTHHKVMFYLVKMLAF